MPLDTSPSKSLLTPDSDPEAIVSEKDSSPPRGSPFPIVGVGASAGGLEAFGQLLRAIPSDSGMAFVLVQHLDPSHHSLLSEILRSETGMPVVTVEDGMQVEPNHVYVIPPNTSMVLDGKALKLEQRQIGRHLPIDTFFCSLAKVQGGRAIGIVLSGNASDGSLGLRAIKAECGLTFVQDEASARFGGMPRNAIATGAVDYVMAPDDIGRELAELGRHPYLLPLHPGDAKSELLPDGLADLQRIFALLTGATKVDFTHYKPTTVRRRIGRRMMVLHVENLHDYLRFVEDQPGELRELYKDLLISVTSFFRDPAAFQALTELVGQTLREEGEREDAFRVWVSGCATGEEIYSLAIALTELLEKLEIWAPLQLFGTDISELALERARQGIYSENSVGELSPERLRRFFTKVDSGYQIVKSIREVCVFARHDVTKDPPFSRVDVLSCRNLLIYLDVAMQRRIFPVFQYALRPTGLLLLGSAESTGAASDLFSAVDKQHNIYRKKTSVSRLPLEFSARVPTSDGARPPERTAVAGETDVQKRLDRLIQARYSPDAVLVDEDLQIRQFRGDTSPYLGPAPGDASLNLLRMARESLRVPLRRILRAAVNGQHTIAESGLVMEIEGRRSQISIEVNPVPGGAPTERHWLVVFIPQERARYGAPVPEPVTNDVDGEDKLAVAERELSDTRSFLRSLTDDYETHAEELRAANEEARSANEELQSTNEELSTTKEELQSANEELTTINEELQNRNTELGATNSDLRNLLAAVSVAIVMVDAELRVRRFNAVAERLLDLNSIDVGRPVGHLRGRLRTPALEEQIRGVIETLHESEQETQDQEGHWYSIVVRPYRTIDNHIAGAVITIQDIDPLKRSLDAAKEARDYAEGMIETVREPLVVLDSDLRVQRATQAFYEFFLVSREETEGRFFYDLGNGQWNGPRLRQLIGAALFRNEPFVDYEIQHEFPHVGRRTMRLNARRISRLDAQNRSLLLAIEDVTERREVAEIRFQRLFETAKDGIVVLEAETGTVLDVNAYLLEATGFSREDTVGRHVTEAGPFRGISEFAFLMPALIGAEYVRHDDLPIRKTNGESLSMELVGNLYQVGSQPVAQLNFRDITARKEQDDVLRRSVEEKALLVREVHHRVKNNLQVIVSLLSLQANYTSDPESIAAFEEAEGRVRAIAHIHETLYATPDLAQIEFAAYLTNLAKELVSLHASGPNAIGLDLQVEEMVLQMEQAIPLGLIANELIVNSLKHGIQGGSGKLTVRLRYRREEERPVLGQELDEGWAQLIVSDNGPGLAPGIDLSQAKSMGFRLLHLLSKQLQGTIKFVPGAGATVLVEFPLSYQSAGRCR